MNLNYFSKIRILDGGMGQTLLAKGLKAKGSLWSATALVKKEYHQLVIDTHLDFIESGADLVSFHPEASKHIHRSIHAIKERGCKAGLVFNPATPLHALENVIEDLDLILIMSVNPGFGGQSFIQSSLDKISQVRKMIDESGKDIRLEVDGGINNETIGLAAEAGADTFVAGSAIFNTDDYKQTISMLRSKLT